MSGNAGDLNNDGYQEIILGNGSPRMERVEPLTILESDGRTFHDVTFTAGLPITGKSHGVNLADLHGDGRMSLLVASGGAYPGDLLTVGAFCPKERVGHYLNIRLVGTRSNRSAIGARIKIEAGGREQHRLVSGGSQFGCLPFEQHFGLGPVTAEHRRDRDLVAERPAAAHRWSDRRQQHDSNHRRRRPPRGRLQEAQPHHRSPVARTGVR